ncbi:hypothetical protein B0H17DRAFT_1192795 [Mycena rosella]|uniref:Pentatricopeptide repeat-containing protein n=1 Tax=Mycena rosella TaxID=1033263 RepID=A0AAD7GVS4_MYCRO|nr:hypothetical protein B0H17DRAFT_1192795 [Mycena rosella]
MLAPRLAVRVPLVAHITRAASFPPKTGSSSKPPIESDPVDPVLFNQLRQRIIERHTSSVELDDHHLQLANTHIFNIKRGLDKRNVDLIRKSWTELHQTNHLHILTREVVEQIARLATASLPSQKSRVQEGDSDRRSFVEQVALAAAPHSTDALNACLLAYLKSKDTRAVFELYEKFKRILETLPPPAASDLTHTTDDIAILASGTIPGRANTTLAVIAAYAMEDSFQGALTEFMNTDVKKLQRYTTEEFLQAVCGDPTLRNKVKIFIERIDLAKSVARPTSISKHIHNLADSPNSPHLENAYTSIIEAMTGPDAYIAADPKFITPMKPVAMTELIWASFLTAFLRRDRKDLAAKVWDDVTRFGVLPGIFTWNMVLDTYGSRGASQDVIGTWGTMAARGLQPDGYSYRALISALFAEKQFEEALQWFRKFQTEVQPTCTAEQATTVYSAVLHGLLHTGRENAATALSLFQQMEEVGPKPNLVSYNTMISYHGRIGDFKGMAAIMAKMGAAGVAGDVFTFSTILSALLKVGRTDAPEMVLGLMRKQGLQPTVVIYTSIIDSQIRQRTVGHLKAGLRLLDEMEKDPNVIPNEITYTAILAGLYRGNWLPLDEAEIYMKDILARMKRKRIQLKSTGYNILIKACLASEQGLETGLGFYQEMCRNKIPRDDTWYIVLAGLIGRGEWQVAQEIVNEMLASGHKPNNKIQRLVNTIRGH